MIAGSAADAAHALRSGQLEKGRELSGPGSRQSAAFSPCYSILVQMNNIEALRASRFVQGCREGERHAGACKAAVELDPIDSRAQLCLGWSHTPRPGAQRGRAFHGARLRAQRQRPLDARLRRRLPRIGGNAKRAQALARDALVLSFAPRPLALGISCHRAVLSGDYRGALDAIDHAQGSSRHWGRGGRLPCSTWAGAPTPRERDVTSSTHPLVLERRHFPDGRDHRAMAVARPSDQVARAMDHPARWRARSLDSHRGHRAVRRLAYFPAKWGPASPQKMRQEQKLEPPLRQNWRCSILVPLPHSLAANGSDLAPDRLGSGQTWLRTDLAPDRPGAVPQAQMLTV